MPSYRNSYEPLIKTIEEDIYANNERKDLPTDFKFDTIARTGVLKPRVFKDDLIFRSKRSRDLFVKAKAPLKTFLSNGEGLPLFALRNKKTFIAVENRVGFLFYRYEILRDGNVPEGSDYKVKGKCGGYTLFKILFCTVTVKKSRYYTTSSKISHLLELDFGKKEEFRKITPVRCSGIRSVYVVESKMAIMKWIFTSNDKFDLNSSLFTIKAAIGCISEVDDDIEDIPEFDWDSCPTIGCMCRTKGALFGLQPQRELKQCPQIFLGESGPPGYDEFSVCWQVKLRVCVSVLVNSLENIDYKDWVDD
ncbi:hypothetical protein SKDZ_14G3990 [Saccharomyces kudriavzevii ZP591]|nr:hypothetical protein SKDZ_14G3990 [Saccharomyces kudriavzevii ZP591]